MYNIWKLFTFGANSGRKVFRVRDSEWGVDVRAQPTKLEVAENELKQLMADVTRAMEKAQKAIARVAGNAAATTATTEPATSSR